MSDQKEGADENVYTNTDTVGWTGEDANSSVDVEPDYLIDEQVEEDYDRNVRSLSFRIVCMLYFGKLAYYDSSYSLPSAKCL